MTLSYAVIHRCRLWLSDNRQRDNRAEVPRHSGFRELHDVDFAANCGAVEQCNEHTLLRAGQQHLLLLLVVVGELIELQWM